MAPGLCYQKAVTVNVMVPEEGTLNGLAHDMKSLAEQDPLLKGIYWIADAGACSGVYVLEQGRTLIDVGNMFGLLEELGDIGPVDRLERILLTHSHFDHIGGVAEVYQRVSPDLYVHPLAREYLRLHRSPFPAFFDALEKDGKLKPVADGEQIEGDPPLTVMHLPGHTAGDVAFYEPRSQALFCGDIVLPHRMAHGATLSKPDEMCGGRLQDKLATLRRLLLLPVRHLLCGHGEPVLDKGADQIKIALMNLYRALEKERPERAWILMGHDLLEAKQFDEAAQCALKALEQVPGQPQALQLKQQAEKGRSGE